MAFDPCGTRKLEGEDILKRLSEYLNVDTDALKTVLVDLSTKQFIADQLRIK